MSCKRDRYDGKISAITSAECARALGQSVGCCGTDGACAANNHVGDRPRGLAVVSGGDDLELVRESGLVDQQDGVAGGIKADSAIRDGAPANLDVHAGVRGGPGAAKSADANLHGADLGPDLLVERVLADFFRSGSSAEHLSCVPEDQGAFKGGESFVDLVREGIAASQI